MQDSSQNPYIPQESEAIRQKVYEHQSPLGRVVKWSLIGTIIVAVLVGIGLFFVVPRTTAEDQPARQKLADALQPPDQTLKRLNVQSQLGFTLSYDNRVYSSYAEVGDNTSGTDNSKAVLSGQTYENNDLRSARAYNYVRISPIESVDSSRSLAPQPPELDIYATTTDKDLTTAAAVPENKGMSKLSLFVKIDGDKRAAKKTLDDNTIVAIEATKPVSSTINGVQYQKVRYTTTNENHRIADVKYDDCYYTIQFDQPYSICIANVRPTSVSAASLVEAVFDSITFQQAATSGSSSASSDAPKSTDGKKTSYAYPLARLAQATKTTDTSSSNDASAADSTDGDASESPLLTITPDYYSNAAGLQAIAKTQPGVVRIGALYCADLSLKFEDGSTATTLSDACVGSLSSGVVVSKDGYIATTGHAIRQQKTAAIDGYINFAPDQNAMLDRLQRVLDYLLKAKILLQSDADYLKTGASTGDQEALAKVQNIASVIPDNFITAVNEQYTYAIQPTDKPIVINHTDTDKPSFAYSDSVLSAKYVASDYDATKSTQEVFASATPTVDVGLLKAEGSFQDVPIAASEDVKANDTLNTIGYPAYTDGSLTIDQIRNIPIVTTSKVEQAYKKDGTRLVQTDTPVLPGNDGAPVVDNSGQLIGFAVYGLSYCPDQLCFGNGTVRSSAELLKLLDDSNIKLQTGSDATASWGQGVTQYFRANYAAASSDFATAGNEYPFNRWAAQLKTLAQSAEGSDKDTSFMNQLQTVLIGLLIVAMILTIVLAIAFFLHRRRISSLQVGHYGEAAAPPAQPATQVPVPGVTQLPPPVQSTVPGQQPAPAGVPLQQPPAATTPITQIPVQPSAPQAPGFVQPTPQPQPIQQPPQAPQNSPVPEDPFYK
jgi:S1-C subfamily serine protease